MEKLDALIMDKAREKYKLVGLALRWAQEIKVKNNLPDPIQTLLPRAVEELLDGTVSRETVEELMNKGLHSHSAGEQGTEAETQKTKLPEEGKTKEAVATDKKPRKEKEDKEKVKTKKAGGKSKSKTK